MHSCVLLEVYCRKEKLNNHLECTDCRCLERSPGYDCLYKHCPYVAFTSCENSLCYVNDKSIAQEIISFGGEMASHPLSVAEGITLWRDISIKKINEAYNEYMNTNTGDGSLSSRKDD